jgi:dephospho-CoA kinase
MTALTKIGLTGCIAGGKTTIASHWAKAGVPIIESDQLSHRTLLPNTETWKEVVRVFGEQILHPDKSVNRRLLGDIVFNDEQKRLVLNRIVHPEVRRMWSEALAALEQAGTHALAVVVIPLLYEVGAESEFHKVVVVGCSEQTQLSRLAARGLNETQARARMRAQWPIQTKMDRADYVIWNDGQLDQACQQADLIWNAIKENGNAPAKKR